MVAFIILLAGLFLSWWSYKQRHTPDLHVFSRVVPALLLGSVAAVAGGAIGAVIRMLGAWRQAELGMAVERGSALSWWTGVLVMLGYLTYYVTVIGAGCFLAWRHWLRRPGSNIPAR